jgi:CheY-like chemotaxis protein
VQPRILLAEDNVINQRLAARMLEKHGHTVMVVNNGQEALDALTRQSFDLVLMDVQMPEMDGFEATLLIREQEKATGRHLPILALTAHAMKGDRERCLAAGMDGYVAKPLQARELYNAVALLIPSGHDTIHEQPVLNGTAEPFDRIGALVRVDSDMELLVELAELFLEDYPRQHALMRRAISDKDAAALETAAHALKGAVGNFCANPAAEAALRLEQIGHSNDLRQAAEALAGLDKEMDQLKPALQALRLEVLP